MEIQLKERLVGAIVLVVLAVIFIPVLISGPSGKDSRERESVPVPLPGSEQPAADSSSKAAKPPEQSYSYDLSKPDTPLVQAPARKPDEAASTDDKAPTDTDQPAQKSPDLAQNRAKPTESSPSPDTGMADSQPAQTARSEPSVHEEPPPATPAPESVSTAPADKTESKPKAPAAEGHWAVQAGSFSERSRADSVAKTLKDKGFAAFVMPVEVHGKDYFRVRVGPQATREAAENVAAKLRKQYKGPAQVVTHP